MKWVQVGLSLCPVDTEPLPAKAPELEVVALSKLFSAVSTTVVLF